MESLRSESSVSIKVIRNYEFLMPRHQRVSGVMVSIVAFQGIDPGSIPG